MPSLPLPYWNRFARHEQRALLVLIGVTLVTRLAYIFRPIARIVTGPYFEDTFYVLNVAWHMARGQGLTVDGEHLTNGIQPLIAFLYVPFFWLGGDDKWLGVRLTFILVAIIECASVYLIAVLLDRLRRSGHSQTADHHWWSSAPIIGASLWSLNYALIINNCNGLETGLYAFLILASILCYHALHTNAETTTREWAMFGVLLGLLVLARIDGTFIVAAYAAVHLASRGRSELRHVLIFVSMAVAVSSPWWIYNYTVFGHLMPQSGFAESHRSHLDRNLKVGVLRLFEIPVTISSISIEDAPIVIRIAICLVSILVLRLLIKSNAFRNAVSEDARRALMPLALASMGFVIYYVFFFSAPWFLARYFHPLRILWTIVLALSLPWFIAWISIGAPALVARNRRLLNAVIAAACIMSTSQLVYNGYFRQITEFYYTGLWAQAHSGELVGMEQTGITGFMADNVVNLDGKVNAEVLQALLAGKRGEYIRRRGIDLLVDWPTLVQGLVEEASAAGTQYVLVDSVGIHHIYRRVE